MACPGAHQVVVGDLQGHDGEPGLHKATFRIVKPANDLPTAAAASTLCILRQGAADPPLGLLEHLPVLGHRRELLHHLCLAQLGEHLQDKSEERKTKAKKSGHLHNKGADEGVGLVGKLDPLLVLHGVGVDVRLGPVDVRRLHRGLVQLPLGESLPVHVELEEDKVASRDLLPRQFGGSRGDQEQLVIGRDDRVQT